MSRRCWASWPVPSRPSWATVSTRSPRRSSARSQPTQRPPGFDLILSRVDMQHGDFESAIAASQAVLDSDVTDPVQRDHALLNLITLATNYGDGERAVGLARMLVDVTLNSNLADIARMTIAILKLQTEREIEDVNRRLRSMAESQRARSSLHFGVTMLNLGLNSLVQDRLQDSLRESSEAVEALAATGGSVERASASVLRMSVLLRLGDVQAAEAELAELMSGGPTFVPNEVFAESADAFDAFSSHTTAMGILDRIGDVSTQTLADRRSLAISRSRIAIRRRDTNAAMLALADYPTGTPTAVGSIANLRMTEAHLALVRGDDAAQGLLRSATKLASTQGATSVRRLGELLKSTLAPRDEFRRTVQVIGRAAPWTLTFAAEELVAHLELMEAGSLDLVTGAAHRHPDRWRTALRQVLDQGGTVVNIAAAHLLEEIGERSDISRLRNLSRSARRRLDASALGRSLARRLADRVMVEDQGRIALQIGDRLVLGSTIRRKVLAMLSFLVTRHEMSASRDQVLDALWPDLDPEIAVNSLNQTIYFLRRVFEESYSEDLTPGYVHHDSDVIWLDPDLVSSRSVVCRQLIKDFPPRPDPEDVDRLTLAYRGRFALDFEYEEWAAAYRDTLHAAYLEIVERAVLDDFTSGHYDRGIKVARRAMEVDPTAEQIEVCLLRLYRVTGAHAAAAEQYAHYSAVVREELGVEPPPLESL